jgi:hypothetical protein
MNTISAVGLERNRLMELARREAADAALRWRLPLSVRRWVGGTGGARGVRMGNSLEFEDHRRYVAGDDLRHVNWNVYARTGQHVLKVFREEVCPLIDVVVDGSRSMALTSRKEVVVRAIAGWTCMAGVGQGASVRGWCVRDGVLEPLSEDFVGQISFSESAHAKGNAPLALEVPWRRGAMRVVITDCLWPEDPGAWLNLLAREASQAVLLLPYAAEESDPEWSGGVEMKDCETGVERLQRVDRRGAEQYQRAYREHFRLWAEEARRRGVLIGRIACADGLSEAFANEGFIAGVVEPR